MGNSPALIHEHDKITIARHIAKHSATPVAKSDLGKAFQGFIARHSGRVPKINK